MDARQRSPHSDGPSSARKEREEVVSFLETVVYEPPRLGWTMAPIFHKINRRVLPVDTQIYSDFESHISQRDGSSTQKAQALGLILPVPHYTPPVSPTRPVPLSHLTHRHETPQSDVIHAEKLLPLNNSSPPLSDRSPSVPQSASSVEQIQHALVQQSSSSPEPHIPEHQHPAQSRVDPHIGPPPPPRHAPWPHPVHSPTSYPPYEAQRTGPPTQWVLERRIPLFHSPTYIARPLPEPTQRQWHGGPPRSPEPIQQQWHEPPPPRPFAPLPSAPIASDRPTFIPPPDRRATVLASEALGITSLGLLKRERLIMCGLHPPGRRDKTCACYASNIYDLNRHRALHMMWESFRREIAEYAGEEVDVSQLVFGGYRGVFPECKRCGKRFARNDSLQRHVSRVECSGAKLPAVQERQRRLSRLKRELKRAEGAQQWIDTPVPLPKIVWAKVVYPPDGATRKPDVTILEILEVEETFSPRYLILGDKGGRDYHIRLLDHREVGGVPFYGKQLSPSTGTDD